MKKTIVMTAVLALILGVSGTQAQVTTERYIPVGQSPGMSGVYTLMGEIGSVAEQGQSFTVSSGGETHTVQITPETRIWLDRSSLREAATTGTSADLVAGRTVEVKYQNEQVRERADWIKVVIGGV